MTEKKFSGNIIVFDWYFIFEITCMRQQALKYSLLSYIPEKENPLGDAAFKNHFLSELYIPFKATAVRMQMLNKRQEVKNIEGKQTNNI